MSSLHSFRRVAISRRKTLFAGILALATLVAVPFPQAHAQAPVKPDVDVEALMKPGPLPENVLGKEDAPYTIVEYSSLTCPHCARLHTETLPKVKEKYIDTGKAKYIIRPFPLDNVAAAAAMLARCVDDSKYFDFVDLLYANQEEWAFGNNPLPALQKFAKQVGFTEEKFNKCLADEELLKNIQAVRDRGNTEFGVRATPTVFINGKKLDDSTIEAFDQIIGGSDGKS